MATGQNAFARAVTDPEAPLPDEIGAAQTRRFAIYRNNVAHTMVEALAATFPVVQRLVGEAFFSGLARAYLAAEPPISPLLFRYGGGFAAFIERFPPAGPVPYLGDVARIEWLRLQAYHAEDHAPAEIAALTALDPDTMAAARLDLHPAVGLVRSRFPVFAIWAASSDAGDAAEVDMTRAEDVAITRPALDVVCHRLPAGGAPFLAALRDGLTLAEAAGTAAAETPDFDPGAHIAGLFQIGAVAHVVAPAAKP